VAKAVVRTPVVTVDSVDLSSVTTSVSLERMVAILESKVSGTSATAREGSILDNKFSLEVHHDTDFSIVDHFWDLVGTKVTVVYKAVNAAVSPTNPSYTFTAVVESIPAIGGTVGEFIKGAFGLAIDGNVTKATS
jgi:hypothetical protein